MLASASLLLLFCCFVVVGRCRFYPHFSPSIVGVILIESDLFMANIEISGHDAQVNWIRGIMTFRYCTESVFQHVSTQQTQQQMSEMAKPTKHPTHLPPVRSLKMKASQHKMPPNDHIFSISIDQRY